MDKTSNPVLEKANRLIILRKLTKLGRSDFAQMASVSVFTYKDWENARFGGIPERRANLLVAALQAEGIKCSVDWLIEGKGDGPKKIIHHQLSEFKEALADTTKNYSPEDIEQLRIKAELEFFSNNNDWETISLIVPDDAMAPYFLPKDLVAGVKLNPNNFDDSIGLSSLVRTQSNKILLRQVQKGKTDGCFTLLCLNQQSKQAPILQDINLVDIAPVVWVRRSTSALLKSYHKK